uniref:Acyl-CoA-binding domain-containing protein 6 n=1 Tax=Lygus hesperus TaxID=30085 RepID=A0A0K8SPJ4_LYGHE
MNTVDEELRARFAAAASHLPTLVPSLAPEYLLKFYGLYKQATVGKCYTPKPNWYQFESKQKWEAWNSLGDMKTEDAINGYISLMSEIAPDWEKESLGSGNGWVSVSTMRDSDSDLDEDDKDIFDHVKEGELEKVKNYDGDINVLDDEEEGMGLLHWAADRGNEDMVKCLLDKGININLRDSDGQTALHYACSCAHKAVVQLLIDCGADTNIACDEGFLPIDVADEDEIKKIIKSCNNIS